MPWAENRIPSDRLHKRSGRAVVTLHGRDVYLGEFNSHESEAEYRRVVAEYLAAGKNDPKPPPTDALTWCELAARYLIHAKGYK